LILDGGTGLRSLGEHLRDEAPVDADLYLTHTHLDHVVGIPFFGALFSPTNRIRMWAGHLSPERTLREVLDLLMVDPLFPVPVDIFKAETSFNDFQSGETLRPRPDVAIRTAPLNHPNKATGYRIDHQGKSICYVTDTEHRPGRLDHNVLDLIRGADLFIYDCTYTDDEFSDHVSWGHSTWQEGVRLADAAEVGTLVIFHHDPSHDDSIMDRIGAAAAAKRPGTVVAREGMILHP
jgi:phosphoribosyl 1,2-cyclic phosphodiesterase